jgi:hypothetical protein
MAKLTFYQRYKSDRRFQERADGLLMESIFAMAGIDAEALCKQWEAGDRELKLEDVAKGLEKPSPAKQEAAKKEPAKRSTARKKSAPKSDDG